MHFIKIKNDTEERRFVLQVGVCSLLRLLKREAIPLFELQRHVFRLGKEIKLQFSFP